MTKSFFVALASGVLFTSAAHAAPPRVFLNDVIRGDNGEIRLGALAETHGGSRAVRDYGRTLNRDHTFAKRQVVPVARSFNVPISGNITPEAREAYDHLLRLRGREFDREFVQHMVDDHQKDIAKFEDQARTGDRRTASLARRQLPVLRKHLRIAQSINP